LCHEKGVVHRDLKPENMLLTAPGVGARLKLIDFGLAVALLPDETLRRTVGTPYYIAPEVLDRYYSHSCDMWSIGVIVFTMLCGYPPFWGDSEREIYARVKRGTYAFEGPEWQTRSRYARDFVQRLLVMQPDKRMTAEEALEHPWVLHCGTPADPAALPDVLAQLRHAAAAPWVARLAAGAQRALDKLVEARLVVDLQAMPGGDLGLRLAPLGARRHRAAVFQAPPRQQAVHFARDGADHRPAVPRDAGDGLVARHALELAGDDPLGVEQAARLALHTRDGNAVGGMQ
jgi:hypothetical protein